MFIPYHVIFWPNSLVIAGNLIGSQVSPSSMSSFGEPCQLTNKRAKNKDRKSNSALPYCLRNVIGLRQQKISSGKVFIKSFCGFPSSFKIKISLSRDVDLFMVWEREFISPPFPFWGGNGKEGSGKLWNSKMNLLYKTLVAVEFSWMGYASSLTQFSCECILW